MTAYSPRGLRNCQRSEGLLSAHVVEKLVDFGGTSGLIDLIYRSNLGDGIFLPSGGHHWLQFGQFPEVLGGGGESRFVLDAT